MCFVCYLCYELYVLYMLCVCCVLLLLCVVCLHGLCVIGLRLFITLLDELRDELVDGRLHLLGATRLEIQPQ